MLNNQVNLNEGRKINISLFKEVLNYVKTRVVGGEGINVSNLGDQIIISQSKRINPSISSGGDSITRVPHLPAIDENMGLTQYKKVFWLSYETGLEEGYADADGDDQVWTLVYPQMRWYPDQAYTANSGIPISPTT